MSCLSLHISNQYGPEPSHSTNLTVAQHILITVHRQNVEVTNAEWTKRRTTKRRKPKRRMGQNVEWKKRPNGTKRRMELTSNGTKGRMGQNIEWKKH